MGFPTLHLINKKYETHKLISEGAFGKVYLCGYADKYYAIKESTAHILLMKHEAKVYRDLVSIENIAQIRDFFKWNERYYLVMDYYKINLTGYKLIKQKSLEYIKSVAGIFKTIIDTIGYIHERGYCHRDLKPDNICLDDNCNPYIIDFGLSKKIKNNKKQIEIKTINAIIGCENYVSLNVLHLIEPSFRDDIEALIYTFFYMIMTDDLYNKYNQLESIDKKKIEIVSHFLNLANYNPTPIEKMMKYIRRMTFTQKPNYHYIKTTLFDE